MNIESTLFTNTSYIEQPDGLIGWLGWLVFLGGVIFLLWRWLPYNKKMGRVQWVILAVLVLLLPLTNLFLALRLPIETALPPPGLPVDPLVPRVVFFAALPWLLAAGLLGPAPAAALAFVSGVFMALWNTHSPFTPLEYSLLALLLGACFQQRYRTLVFRALRHPLPAALLLGLLYPLIYILDTLFVFSGSLASRLDYALDNSMAAFVSMLAHLLIAGLVGELAVFAFPRLWGGRGPLVPSPAERRLQTRFLASLAPLAVILMVGLIAGDWIVAGTAARQMLEDRMQSTASMAAQGVPFFHTTGQALIQDMASDPRWYQGPREEQTVLLEEKLRNIPFFRQLYLLDEQGDALAGYPTVDFYTANPSPKEFAAIDLAIAGLAFQSYPIAPVPGESVAQVSFIAAIKDEGDQVHGVLIGRTDLATNPLTQPVLSTLGSISDVEGEGMLLDDDGRILFHSANAQVMELYQGDTSQDPAFFADSVAPDGTRRMLYYQPVKGQPWAVVTIVPARQAQQLALRIAAPLLGMILVLFFLAAVLLRLALRVVTASLQSLASEANRISSGRLDRPLQLEGEDEVGQLRRAFEHMRVSLKDRLDELNRVLVVSQGVASSLELGEALKPVLDAAISTGVTSARVVLSSDVAPEAQVGASPVTRFGIGSEAFSHLDEQILALARQQDQRIVITNPTRVRNLSFPSGASRPDALLGMPLRHENLYFGVMWVAYDTPHQFSEDEVRFLSTLAGQAVLAAGNARLFASAEVGRQQLEAILASTPDPVLVTDQQNNLLLANPAAWQALDLNAATVEDKAVEKIIQQGELVRLLTGFSQDRLSTEVRLPDGLMYMATASTVMAGDRPVGRICVLRDITHLKELDQLKSDFVSTVSHDLRSPLTLMRGYATMLEMVGELNEQQTNYVRKMVTGVENMTRLVNTLLDLGRIEAGLALQLEAIPIHDIVDRVVGGLQIQASQKQIQMTCEISQNMIPLVEADHALLQQAMHNLVENAVKYTDPGGQVQVRVYQDRERMVFEVIDSGIGIAPVDIPLLFKKFSRAGQKEAKKRPGSGLGLAIVKSVVERHQGQVWVESQLGKGSTFFFAIPFRQPSKNTG
ncbi:MAG TPA: ATP-binding protein [Anaerolineales bacterium]|nr:ATP-binding protein [Anaerolineales bacterium]